MTTVLVVDDEPIVRDVVARYLERDGHSILTADSGDAARGLIEGEAPSLVVLDVMLPGETDGLALCRWIRATSDLPAILLTARGAAADRIAGPEPGADGYAHDPRPPRPGPRRTGGRARPGGSGAAAADPAAPSDRPCPPRRLPAARCRSCVGLGDVRHARRREGALGLDRLCALGADRRAAPRTLDPPTAGA